MFGAYPGFRSAGSDFTARQRAGQAQADARSAQSRVQELEHEIERLLMITEAMWTFFKEEFEVTDEELARRVMEIDMQDGVLDGRKAKTPARECPECGRKLNKRHLKCLYCGALYMPKPFER